MMTMKFRKALNSALVTIGMTYGWSQDVEMQTPMTKAQKSHPEINDVNINQYWAYNIKYDDYRIYVADDQILTMFQLRWA